MNTPSRSLRTISATMSLALVLGLIAPPSANAAVAPLKYSQSTASGHLRLAEDLDNGRVVEVVGDLATADRIAVLVPGIGNSIENFGDQDVITKQGSVAHRLLAKAKALREQVLQQYPTSRVAVIAWLGYIPPAGIGPAALDQEPARDGAADLARLRAALPAEASVTWVCHSYGTLVCAEAASSGGADQIVLLASPGISANTLSDLDTSAAVWSGRNDDDPVKYAQLLNYIGLGYGADPARTEFGAQAFPKQKSSGHSDYFRVGSRAMQTLAQIVQTGASTSAKELS